jgi:hypothetical protein
VVGRRYSHDQLADRENELSLYLDLSVYTTGQADVMGRCNSGIYPSKEHFTQSS